MARTVSSSLNGSWKRVHQLSGWPATVTTGTSLDKSFYFTRDDIRKSPKDSTGWREPQPYSAQVASQLGPEGTWTNYGFGDFRQESGVLRGRTYTLSFASAAPSVSAGLRSQAEVAALLKLKDQKVNLAQAFAERGQTAGLFTQNIGRIAKSFSQLKRGNVKQAADALGVKPPRRMPNELGARWLELQYGWKPLLSDIYGSCEALDERSINDYRVSVSATRRLDVTKKDQPWHDGRNYCPLQYDERSMTGVKVRLDYIPSNVLLQPFVSLGLTNPLYLAWELVPYSFVVDWAYPIGDWLSALDAAFGYTFKGGTRTEIGRGRWNLRGYKAPQSSSSVLTGRVHHMKMTRVVYPSSPIPTLPRLKNPWSYGHAANAAALLAVAFGRKR